MLRRHRLAWLGDAGWREALAAAPDGQAFDCLALWRRRDLPLVVTRQRRCDRLALGLPAPAAFGRRRLAIEVGDDAVRRWGRFPPAAAIAPQLAPSQRRDWSTLCRRLSMLGCEARVYGAHGWQLLTGMDHLHEDSDIDLLLPAADAATAAALCAALAGAAAGLPRLDGELVFADGAEIAWREWLQARRGAVGRVLVKRLYGAELEDVPARRVAPAC